MNVRKLGFGSWGLGLALSLLAGCGDGGEADGPVSADEVAQEPSSEYSTPIAEVDPNKPVVWPEPNPSTPQTQSSRPTAAPTTQPTPPTDRTPQAEPSRSDAPVSSGAVAFEKHTLTEQTTGMPACTVLVPKGWTMKSNIQRTPPQLAAMFAFTDVLISAPDGREIHFYPSMTFHYSDRMQAPPFSPMQEKFFLPPPNSLGEVLLQMAQINPDPTIKNLRVVSEEEIPALTRRVRELAAGLYQSMDMLRQNAMPDTQVGFDTQGKKIVFRYEQNGQPKEETFVATWQIQFFNTPTTGTNVHWGIYNMRSISGPIGSNYFQDPVLLTIAQSMQITPQWDKAMYDYYVARAPRPISPTQPTKPGKTPGEILAETRELSNEGWKKNQATNDAVASREIDMIYEETPYTDTDGSTVRLSNHWNHVVSDGQGTILMHNDANWNINADRDWNQRDWQTLTPQQ